MYGPPDPSIIFPIFQKPFFSTWNPPNITKIESKVGYSYHWICFATFAIARSYVPSKHSSWWRRFEDVLKTSSVFVFRRRLQDIFKTSWSRSIYSSWPYVFKTSSRRFQDLFKTSSRRLAKMSSRRFPDVFKMSCKNVFKTSSRRFESVFKTSSRRFQDVLSS